jgi:hypothetical protein
MFSRFVGIDYSGAETPSSSLKALQVFNCEHDGLLRAVPPPQGPKKYWTRQAIAEWLVRGPMFEPLKDVEYFKAFTLDPMFHTLTWPNGADIAPEFLHDNAIVTV